ncbi:homoserine kinase [Bacillus aquiflavi]|uniref:Homoserine kinase n=1 Tax=Bacillus aquiflavi TaxID=2672567 RepID=A0A6B3VXC3_9BACI|nr:homoserine kinase [Bacillus aquiflavi]MBA4536009.1 homoserine kinase [Bacillus aquiflavi]NEY80383.1 homoserine kinase [Bacillus aquiflavi]
MNEGDMLVIKVPASTANLGPGFDSIGLALSLYLTLEVEKSEQWKMIPLTKEMEQFPEDEQHFICQIALQTASRFGVQMTPCRIRLNSEIPLARGLGSSAAAIVAGIELANAVCHLNLTNEQKLEVASQIEGHPDNVGASIFGGLVVGSQKNGKVYLVSFHHLDFETVVVIPNEQLLTKSSREVLPKELPFLDAVLAGTVGNVFIAAMLSGNWKLAGEMMGSDRYHQPYRRHLVPLFDTVEKVALKKGAFGVALSGAGPTVICFTEKGKSNKLTEYLSREIPHSVVASLKIDQRGSVTKIVPVNKVKNA